MTGFLKNNKVDVEQCLSELNRRALEANNPEFRCSIERFTALATENEKLTPATAREAMTVLNGEILGYYKNSRREDYGKNVLGIDFVVEGIGEFENSTHVEVKNPVGSEILKANGQKGSLSVQAKAIARKITTQKHYWSDYEKLKETIPELRQDANFPKQPENVLTVVDTFDMPVFEKKIFQENLQGRLNAKDTTNTTIYINTPFTIEPFEPFKINKNFYD